MKRLQGVNAARSTSGPKVAFQLRLDEVAHQKVKAIAAKEFRSFNAQIEYFVCRGIAEYEKEHETAGGTK